MIPLFPLNTVLFPNQPLSIQIFEERYQRMLEDVLAKDKSFGVVFIQSGQEAHGPLPQPHAVGTIAQIEDLREVGDNRFLLRTTGRHRFRVVRQDRGADYLRAEIEPFPFASYNYQELLHTVPSLQEMIHTYMEKTTGGVESKVAQLELPEEPERLAFLAINLLQISMPEKQRYLEERDFPRFVAALQKAYRENIRLLNVLEKRVSQMGEDYPFSLN